MRRQACRGDSDRRQGLYALCLQYPMEMTHMMVKQQYKVSFVTPAFLGDADQNGAWRTPPFKALLRQWWRVVAAKDHGYDHVKLREAEGRLFGNAWLENNFSQSQVKLRLDNWRSGKMSSWAETPKNITHPEIKFPIDSNLYLGYGPLTRNKEIKKTTFKDKVNAAIQAEESNLLKIINSDQSSSAIHKTLQLIHWFGTLGGRSRNGWGSLLLEGSKLKGLEALKQSDPLLNELAKPLDQCLDCTWPHAIGKDQGCLLIWISKKSHDTWREAMMELAKIKIEFRTNLTFVKDKGKLDQRHVLAYPVTRHPVNAWEKYKVAWSSGTRNGRLANQIRFKVTKDAKGKYLSLVYHMPCSIPEELLNTFESEDRTWIVGQQIDIWQSVHGVLDKQMQRIP